MDYSVRSYHLAGAPFYFPTSSVHSESCLSILYWFLYSAPLNLLFLPKCSCPTLFTLVSLKHLFHLNENTTVGL